MTKEDPTRKSKNRESTNDTESTEPSNRRKFLKTVTASATALGLGNVATTPALAHHAESPDKTFDNHSQSCYYDYRTTSAVNIAHYFRGYDSDRHKYEFVTTIGGSAAADKNGSAYTDIQKAEMNLQWDDTKFSGDRLEENPSGYDPTVYGYQQTSDPDDGEEIAEAVSEAAADVLVNLVPGLDYIWTGSELVYNLLLENENTQDNGGDYSAWFEYSNWNNGYVSESHYNWIIHVYLEEQEALDVKLTNTHHGYYNTTSSETQISYYVTEWGAQSVNHSNIARIDDC